MTFGEYLWFRLVEWFVSVGLCGVVLLIWFNWEKFSKPRPRNTITWDYSGHGDWVSVNVPDSERYCVSGFFDENAQVSFKAFFSYVTYLGRFSSLEEAKSACEQHRRKSRVNP